MDTTHPPQLLKLLDLTSLKELVDLDSNALANTWNLVGTAGKLVTVGHLERELVDCVGSVVVSLLLELVGLIVAETVKNVGQLLVVGDKKLITGGIRFVVDELSLIRGDRLHVGVILAEERVNLGSDTLTDAVDVEKALPILHLVIECIDNVSGPPVRGILVKVGRHVREFPEVLGDILVHLERLGPGSRLVERLECGDLFFIRLVEKLLELLDLGARRFVELLELEDVTGDGSNVHVGSSFDENLEGWGSLRLKNVK